MSLCGNLRTTLSVLGWVVSELIPAQFVDAMRNRDYEHALKKAEPKQFPCDTGDCWHDAHGHNCPHPCRLNLDEAEPEPRKPYTLDAAEVLADAEAEFEVFDPQWQMFGPGTFTVPGDECTCFVTDEKYWFYYGSAVEPGSQMEPNPECRVHFPNSPAASAAGVSPAEERANTFPESGEPSAGCQTSSVPPAGDCGEAVGCPPVPAVSPLPGLIAEVLAEHQAWLITGESDYADRVHCYGSCAGDDCAPHGMYDNQQAWREHVSPLIAERLESVALDQFSDAALSAHKFRNP